MVCTGGGLSPLNVFIEFWAFMLPWFLCFGPWSSGLVFGLWFVFLVPWSLVLVPWSLVIGALVLWCLVLGLWSLVLGL